MKARSRNPQDSGAALVLALVLITIVSVGLLGLGSLTQSNLKATAAISTTMNRAVGSDDAIDQVVTQLRNSTSSGIDPTSGSGGTCTGPSSYAIAAGTYGNSSPITVTCLAEPNSGAATTVTTSPDNVPDNSVLATSASETGITVGGNGTLNIGGSVLSNSPLTTGTGSISTGTQAVLKSDGTIKAVGACTGPATNYSPSCQTGATAQSDYLSDSKWDSETLPTNSISTSDITGHCGTGNGLKPGIYTDSTALNTLIAGCNGVILFKPGVYYFDFTTGSDVLTIANANAKVVGGVLSSDPTVVGSACDQTQDGVQFVFGGDSRLSVTAGSLELCPYIHTSKQEIAIYGLRQGSSPTSATTPATTPSTATTPNGKGAFSSPSSAEVQNGVAATYAGDQKKDAVLDLSGFDFSSVPSGATISSAKVSITYSSKNTNSSFTGFNLDVTDGSGTATPTKSLSLSTGGSFTTDTFSLTTPASVSALSGMTAEITAQTVTGNSGNASDTVGVDGVSMTVTYTPKATYNAQSGCITATDSSACVFLYADGSNADLSIHGTVYSWNGSVSLNLPNNIGVALQRGAVARTFALNVPASLQQTTPVVSLPGTSTPGPPQDRDVVLTAVSDGLVILRVEVVFKDNEDQSAPVKHWSMVGG